MDDPVVDLRHRRLLEPDVYYKCPTLESLDAALRNELERVSQSLIPEEAVIEFLFSAEATITIPVSQQANLGELGIFPAELPQVTTVDRTLCRDIVGQSRLKIQRAIAKCFVELVQQIDGFQYRERRAENRENSDGIRFKFVCTESLQNRDRIGNRKRGEIKDGEAITTEAAPQRTRFPSHDCGGAIHIKFSTKKNAINLVYRHTSIHRDKTTHPGSEQKQTPINLEPSYPTQVVNGFPQNGSIHQPSTHIQPVEERTANDTPPKRKRRKKSEIEAAKNAESVPYSISNSPQSSRQKKAKTSKNSAKAMGQPSRVAVAANKSKSTAKQPKSPSKSRKKAPEPVPRAQDPAKGKQPKVCVRCRENKLRCDGDEPFCGNCAMVAEYCDYTAKPTHTRSKTGCFNCRRQKRKCGEQKPSCAYCTKINEYCEYEEY